MLLCELNTTGLDQVVGCGPVLVQPIVERNHKEEPVRDHDRAVTTNAKHSGNKLQEKQPNNVQVCQIMEREGKLDVFMSHQSHEAHEEMGGQEVPPYEISGGRPCIGEVASYS